VVFFILTAASTWVARYFLPFCPHLIILTAHTFSELTEMIQGDANPLGYKIYRLKRIHEINFVRSEWKKSLDGI